MKVLWTLVKVVIALALAIPISIIVLATALGVLGALVGIAFLALKLAVFGLVGWGVFRLLTRLLGGPARVERMDGAKQLAPVDPHYEAAMRELDRELGETPR
jgi:ABC-type transport system involved in cytochrome c biogenesis permease subunit